MIDPAIRPTKSRSVGIGLSAIKVKGASVSSPFSLEEIGVQVRNMMARVALSKENSRLSLRLQELYEQLNRLQGERTDSQPLELSGLGFKAGHEELNDRDCRGPVAAVGGLRRLPLLPHLPPSSPCASAFPQT